MGVVYRGWDPTLSRPVAIKMIVEVGGAGASVERFVREARSAGRLRHPAIVAVHDAGVFDGRPYIVMDFVEGATLAQVIEEHGRGLPPPRAARLVREIAAALHHAHGEGVVHRDVKPLNIIVDADGAPKLTDFGVARDLSNANRLTATGEMVGTPAYVAPEQLRGDPRGAGPAADVYAIGAVLYHALTGVAPYRGAGSLPEMIVAVMEGEPERLRAIDPSIPAPLEAIVRRCMRKKPEKRFESAGEVVRALDRFLDPERGSRGETGSSGSSRTLVAAVAGTALLVGSLGVAVGWIARGPGASPPVAAAPDPRSATDPAGPSAGADVAEVGPDGGDAPTTPPGVPAARTEPLEAPLPDGALFRLGSTRLRHGNVVSDVTVSCDGALLASAGQDTHVRVWDAVTGAARGVLDHDGLSVAVGFSPRDPDLLVTGSTNEVVTGWNARGGTRRWVSERGAVALVRDVVLSPDGERIAAIGSRGTIRILDAADGTERARITCPPPIAGAAFSPEGSRLVVALGSGPPGALQLHDAANGERLWSIDPGDVPTAVAFSSDGGQILCTTSRTLSGRLRVLDAATGSPLRELLATTPMSIAVNGDRERPLVAMGMVPDIRVLDPRTWTPVCEIVGRSGGWTADTLVFAGPTRLISGDQAGGVRIWNVETARPVTLPELPPTHEGGLNTVVFSKDGERIATASRDASVRVWDAADGSAIAVLSRNASRLAFCDGGRSLAAVNGSHVWIADALTGARRQRVAIPSLSLAMTPDGTRLAAAGISGQVVIVEVASGEARPFIGHDPSRRGVRALAWSPDGRALAVASNDERVEVLDGATGAAVMRAELPRQVTTVIFVDAGTIAVAGLDRSVHVISLPGGEQRLLSGHSKQVDAVAASADGQLIAGAGMDDFAIVWEVATGAEVARLAGHASRIEDLAFSPDGRRLATASADGTALIWDLDRR